MSLEPLKDASSFYEVERRQIHAERPGFRISELQISPTQQVPWHYHTRSGESCSVPPRRPHLVVNGGDTSATFLVLQGIGEYDFMPLVEKARAK